MNLDLKVGKRAELLIKPTAISVLNQKCEFENILSGKLKEVEKGEILARVLVDIEGFDIESIMIKELADFNDEVFVAFKANEVTISKVFE
jgi:molybdopterin-binding protein